MINKQKLQEKQEKAKKIEKIENRIIINYGIAAVGYMALNTLKNYPFNMQYKTVWPIAIGMFVAALLCYGLHIKFKKTANYGHMFIGFTLALLLPISRMVIARINMGLYNSLMNVELFAKVTNSANAVKIVSWLGVIYLVGMTIFNGILIYKVNHAGKKKSISSQKAKKTVEQ